MTTPDAKVKSLREEAPHPRSLHDRIADAFESPMPSGDLSALLAEVEQTSTAAKAQSADAEVRALDPKLRPAEVEAARRQMEDANFQSKRMDVAAADLTKLLASTKAKEESEVRRKAHEEALAERDQLVKDLAVYEKHAAAIVALLQRIQISNSKLHMDEQAERIARGADLAWNVRHDETLPKLSLTRLPKYRKDGSIEGYLWPRSTY